MKINTNPDRTDTLIDTLTTLWEALVRATHHFLTGDDINKLVPFVRIGLSEIETLVVAECNQKPAAFIAILGSRHLNAPNWTTKAINFQF